MKRKMHITLDDIARRLKVSRVTVSKALRGHPDISRDTKAKVRKLAMELGYSPNLMARNLSARRSRMIGFVIPKIAHYFFSSLIESAYNTAFENEYELILTVSHENPERERKHIQTLVSMRVDGIVVSITESTTDLEAFHWVRKMGIPLIFMDRVPDPPLPGFSTVVVDDRNGAYKAIEHAVKLGYRKFAHLAGSQSIGIGRNRYEGFRAALEAQGIPVRPEWIITGGFGKEDGYKGFMHLFKAGELPEFIFAVTYPVALGVYEAARDVGVHIPTDVDIMCFGDSDMHRFISPALSCVNQPTQELGRKAVQMMLEILQNPDEDREYHVEIPTDLILRETGIGKGIRKERGIEA